MQLKENLKWMILHFQFTLCVAAISILYTEWLNINYDEIPQGS